MVKKKRKSDPPAGGEGGGGGGGGAKRRRRGRREAPTDRISKLPDDMLEEIVERLPFMDFVRSGALSREFFSFCKRRTQHLSSKCCKSFPPRRRLSMQISLEDDAAPERELKALEQEPRPCLHHFSLVVKTSNFKAKDLESFLNHAAECRVEELHINMRKASSLKLPLKHLSPHLACLSLHCCSSGISSYQGSQALSALEVIELYRVTTTQSAFRKKLFPRLRILDLRECKISFSDCNKAWPANLRSVTMVGCKAWPANLRSVNLAGVPSLRSFSFSGSFHDAPFSLPRDATLSSLYINFGSSGIPNTHQLNNALPNDLSGLNVLTVCSNTLSVLSSRSDDGATCQMLKQRSLHSLRELQLIMIEMEPANLADIYVFLKTFRCPNLERLFVKLPPYLKEGSQDDEVRVEPPEDGLHNLKIVKVNDFNWSRAEVLLVSFLLRKASSLQKMLLVSVSHNAAPVDIPGVQEADLLLIEEALTNGKLLLSKSDDAATQPYHSGKVLLSKSDDAATQPYHSKDVDPSLPPKNQQYFYVQDLSVRQSREAFCEGLLRDAGTQPYHSKDVDSSLPQKNHSLLGPEI